MEVQEQKHQWVNRRQRRSFQRRAGILRAKSKLNFGEWSKVISNNIINGKKRHEEYTNTILKSIETQLEAMEQRIRLTCNEWGYTKEQADEHVSKWVDGLKLWSNN
jgi:hypothetical protein